MVGKGVLLWAHSGYLKLDHPHRLLVLLQTGIIVIHNHSLSSHFSRMCTFCFHSRLLTLSWADGAADVWVVAAAAPHHKARQPTRPRPRYSPPAKAAAAPSCHGGGGVGCLCA